MIDQTDLCGGCSRRQLVRVRLSGRRENPRHTWAGVGAPGVSDAVRPIQPSRPAQPGCSSRDRTVHVRRESGSDAPYLVPPPLPGTPLPTPVVVGVVAGTVVGGDDDSGGDFDASAGGAASGAGAGSGAGGVGSLAIAALAALVGGIVMAGREGGAVVGTVFVSGGAGRSSSLSTAIMDPKPTRNAATHASGITTARPPILAKKVRRPSSSSAASIASRSASSCRRRAPSVSGCAAGAVGAASASRCAAGSVASSTSGTPLALISEVVTIGRASATDSFAKPGLQTTSSTARRSL
jgi:hypothetical protein